jgi:hypothetical protein
MQLRNFYEISVTVRNEVIFRLETYLLAGRADENGWSLQNAYEDWDELLQENHIYWASCVMLKIVPKLTRSLNFELHIYKRYVLLGCSSRGYVLSQQRTSIPKKNNLPVSGELNRRATISILPTDMAAASAMTQPLSFSPHAMWLLRENNRGRKVLANTPTRSTVGSSPSRTLRAF